MNIHPLFVHFPIAFLTVYALFEILRIPKIVATTWYRPVKIALVFIGTISSFFALQTGELAGDIIGETKLIETHAGYATASSWIFAVLAGAYLITLIQEKSWFRPLQFISPLVRLILKMAPFIAIIGLVTLMITGSLGGAIVYGKDIDPIVSFVYAIIIGN